MDSIRKHRKIWNIVIVIATISLIIMSFLPYLSAF